ncbi:MAG TPA: phosphatase [Synergistales bacterium]|nr:phosphatase [Synergistales bacterium]
MRFGAIDLGSNSVRCLAVSARGRALEYINSGVWITRLTEGIGGGNVSVGDKPLARTLDAVEEALLLLGRSGVPLDHVAFRATESLRSATNRDEIIFAMEKLSGLSLEVLNPAEEARLGWEGASLGVPGVGMVFDLGGGSLDVGTADRTFSFPLGAVRMTALFGEDPAAVMEETVRVVGGSFEDHPARLVGVGGTSSSAVMMMEGIPVTEYTPERLHGRTVECGELEKLTAWILATPPGDRSSITGLEKGRADIIVAGISVIRAFLGLAGVTEYIHSETDLLWALCLEAAAEKGFDVSSVMMPRGTGR